MFGIGLPELIIMLIIFIIIVAVILCVLFLTIRGSTKTIPKERDMFCPKCGTKNEDNAATCIQCGNDLQHLHNVSTGAPEGMKVSSYLAQAILVTIFCCLPLGIPAIVFAAQVNGKLAAGDYDGALDTSRKAKIWCWVSFGVGIGFFIIWALLGVFAGLLGIGNVLNY